MQNYDLSSLNDEQLSALKQVEGAVLVTAGAGSGKTRLLTHRIAYLIKEKNINPYNILAITFTNKAANEMKERTADMLDGMSDVWISTFHSCCVKILRRYIDLLGYKTSFSIYNDSDSDKLLDQILIEKKLDADKRDFKKLVSFHISNCKNNNMSLKEYHEHMLSVPDIDKIMDIFSAYEKRLFDANALDFDDLLIKTYELLVTNEQVREYYTERFQYILVDEFQDTNIVQYELVRLLSSKHKNVFVVGDEDQCIYTWRGASYKNIARFVKDFENVKMFKLETNYRSTPNILSLANSLISHNTSRIEKVLKSVKNNGSQPEFYNAYDEQEEANFVISKINFLIREKGYKYNDFAILMRMNALTLAFEQALLSYNMPYKIYGGFKFYERAEIRIVLSYLKLFVNPQDEIALLRVINFPKRGIGDGAIGALREVANENGVSLIDVILNLEGYEFKSSLKQKFEGFANIYKSLLSDYETMPLGEFAAEVVKRFDIKSAYNINIEEEYFKQINIDQLCSSISEFGEKNIDLRLGDYLESVTLMSDIDNMDSSENVTVATVHSVKGLEFPVVFVIGVEDGIFPISRAFDRHDDMEEERRLMYVAITRAKDRLFISHTTSRYLFSRRAYQKPSRFLSEIGYKQHFASPVREFENKNRNYFEPVENNTSSISFDNIRSQVMGKTTEESEKPSIDISRYKAGQKVVHTRYGMGTIIQIAGTDADIKFESVGIKTLILTLAPLEIIE